MPRVSRAVVCAAAALVLLSLGSVVRFNFVHVALPETLHGALPAALASCPSLHGLQSDWRPRFVDPDFETADSYQCAGYRVHVSVVQYVEQRQGKEAVGEFNAVIPRSWWNSTKLQRRIDAGHFDVEEVVVDRGDRELTIWNWYAVGDVPTSTGFSTKAMEALNALRLRRVPTTAFAIAIESAPGRDTVPILKSDVPRIWSWFIDRVGASA